MRNTPTDSAVRRIYYNDWAEPLYTFPSRYDYRIMYGGRGSSKTYQVTQALIALAHQKPLRIAVAREHRVSIEESALPELASRVQEMGLLRKDCFEVTRWSLNHANGSHIFFIGLSVVSEEDIRGMSMVDILWVEEAHRMSRSSWELVYPTIRKDGAEIWLTFNPKSRTDVAWELAQRTDDPTYWIKRVNWRDNAFFTPRNNRDRLRDKEDNPDRYAHIWEGEPDDSSEERKVLPRTLLMKCVEAWDKRPPRGAFRTGGFDVADTGNDHNALAIRSGPELYYIDKWRGSLQYTVSDSTRRVAEVCRGEDVTRLQYDGGGAGAGVRGPLYEWMRNQGHNFATTACLFGGAVQAPNTQFIRGSRPKKQKEYFANWASQAGWTLRLRAEMTARLMNGEEVDLDACLFINPDMKDLESHLSQMAQPEWTDDTGKLRVMKQPKHPGMPEPPSPDAYDAVVLAFSTDARRGIVQR